MPKPTNKTTDPDGFAVSEKIAQCISGLLGIEQLRLPIDWSKSANPLIEIRSRFQAFHSALRDADLDEFVSDKSELLELALNQTSGLERSLESSLVGKVSESWGHFRAAMESFQPLESHLDWSDNRQGLAVRWGGAMPLPIHYYRFREMGSPLVKISKDDLFHIPFQKRHLVSSQRFSAAGIPCLYLAGSAYLGWHELGQPPFHRVMCTSFTLKPKQSLRFLDLRLTFDSLDVAAKDLMHSQPTDLYKHLFENAIRSWPLVAVCSLVVKERCGSFFPEYLIPQMLLQWVIETSKFDGIASYSTRIRPFCLEGWAALANYCIPAHFEIDSSLGRCPVLDAKLCQTEPISWDEIIALDDGETRSSYYWMPGVDGSRVHCSQTNFGRIEGALVKRNTQMMRK